MGVAMGVGVGVGVGVGLLECLSLKFKTFQSHHIILSRSLPHYIREQLLHQRKYIFTVHEVSTRLKINQ